MRTFSSLALSCLLFGCVSQTRNAPRKDRPLVVRVAPNGYELVEEDGIGNRRECSIEEIVGSHIPAMVCVDPDQREAERQATQNDLMMPRNCRDFWKCTWGDPGQDGMHNGKSTR